MKDKLIKNIHFDYVNDMIKILGFYDLADFETCVIYSELKLNQKTICEKYTKSLQLFKKIFPQEGFDLRKINYCFENIDQVIAFIKKLFLYLGINYSYSRKNKNIVMHLIQPNNLYNKYIMNLWNIPQNKTFLTESVKSTEITDQNTYLNVSDILNPLTNNKLKFTPMVELMCHLKNSFEKKYIFTNLLLLGNIKSFDYFNWIRVRNGNSSKLDIGTIIYLEIGGSLYVKKIINETTKFDEHNYYKYEIDFPNNIFYQYHEIKLHIGSKNPNSNNNFQALINGRELKSNVPKSLFEHNISFEHDNKWFIEENQQIVIVDKMVGIKNNGSCVVSKDIETKYIDFLEKNRNKIQIINYIEFSSTNIEFLYKGIETLIFIDDFEKYFKDKNDSVFRLMMDEKSIKFFKENFKIKSSLFSIGSNTKITTNPMIQEITSKSTFKYYYMIEKLGDGIKHIDLMIPKYIKSLNKSNTYKINIWIEDKTSKVNYFKTFDIDNELKLEFDKNIINLIGVNSPMLVVEIPESNIDDWNEINMVIGYIYHCAENRRIIASNFPHTQIKIIDM